jgi:hypothetical protein
MRCRSRGILICERLLPSSRLSWRSAGSRALPSIVNPAGRSAAHWRLTDDRRLKRATWSGAARVYALSATAPQAAAGAMGRDLLLPPHFRNRKEDPFDAAVVTGLITSVPVTGARPNRRAIGACHTFSGRNPSQAGTQNPRFKSLFPRPRHRGGR